MKKPLIFTIAIAVSMLLKAQNIDYEQYFGNNSLRDIRNK